MHCKTLLTPKKFEFSNSFEEKDEETKIAAFQDLYKEMNIPQIALDTMEELHKKSVDAVNATALAEEDKARIIGLGEVMLRRTK
jgi:geranylgeranyl diphosphate synthase type II